jgi:AcrR family transcriptional regulator
MTEKRSAKRKRPGPGRLSAEQAEALPDRILDAALEQFSEHGFSDTTMDQIARAAGASTKTIYARYANKEDVLKAVIKRIVDRTVAIHDREAPVKPSAVSPRDYLQALCVQICLRISTEAGAINRLAVSGAYRMPELKRLHRMSIEQGARFIRDGLEHWHAQGMVRDLKPAEFDRAAHLGLSMATDWTRIRTSLGDPPARPEIEEHVAYAVGFFLHGCGVKEKAAATARKPARQDA